MSARKILDPSNIHPAALAEMNARHADTVAEVEAAIRAHPVVVVGMAQNPHVRKLRVALRVKEWSRKRVQSDGCGARLDQCPFVSPSLPS